MRPRSLKAIVAIYVGAILIALAAVRSVDYVIAHDALGREVDRRIASEAVAISGRGGAPDYAAMAKLIAAEAADHDTADLYLMLVDAAGRHRAGTLHLRTVPHAGYSDLGGDAAMPGVLHGRAFTQRLADGGAVVVVSDNDVVDAFDALHMRVQLIELGITALIVIGGAWGIAVAVSGRMRALQRTVDAVIAGDLRSRVPLDGSRSEFDQEAVAFNRMLDRIEALMIDIQHAAKDITHEIKSPIARLRSRAAALARHAQGSEHAGEIEALVEQSDQILDLFSSLQRLWEVEGGARRARFAEVELGALAAEVIEGLEIVAEDAGQVLGAERLDPVSVRGDVNLLRQMLVNLIENAVKHAPAGTVITVSLARREVGASLMVSDTGPGIPADQHALVVRKFGRVAGGRAEGQGLGLALVDAIVRLHDGALRLEDATPGLRVMIDLPLGAPSKK